MDIEERTREIIKIFKKINELQLGIGEYEEFHTFRKICNQYIRSGVHTKGKIPLPGTKRIICFKLKDQIECVLKYDPDI